MKNKRQIIDFDEKIALSKCMDEFKEWKKAKENDIKWKNFFGENHGINFCEGWYVDCYEQMCGHWEILQTPIYQGMTESDAKKEMILESRNRKCTNCTCNFK